MGESNGIKRNSTDCMHSGWVHRADIQYETYMQNVFGETKTQ